MRQQQSFLFVQCTFLVTLNFSLDHDCQFHALSGKSYIFLQNFKQDLLWSNNLPGYSQLSPIVQNSLSWYHFSWNRMFIYLINNPVTIQQTAMLITRLISLYLLKYTWVIWYTSIRSEATLTSNYRKKNNNNNH